MTDKHILVVDDNETNLKLMKQMLSDSYKVSAVTSGKQALSFLSKKKADLVLLDVNMPGMDGPETLKYIKESSDTKDIPVIFLMSGNDRETEAKCMELGAEDFLTKPLFMPTVLCRINRILEFQDLQKNLEKQVKDKTHQLERISLRTLSMIANIVDARDSFCSDHSIRVAKLSAAIAKRLDWKAADVTKLYYIALLHDIGMLGVPDSILKKTSHLTEEEYTTIKQHTVLGKEVLRSITAIENVSVGAEFHHERYDGTGYPSGLLGEEIPIEARIISVADAFTAMNSERAYRARLPMEEIAEELKDGSGGQFDPGIVEIVLDFINDNSFDDIMKQDNSALCVADESADLLQKIMTEYTAEVKNEALRDSLTGVWNRSYMEEKVNQYLRDNRHSGIFFMIDMDGFKCINDTYGHIAGDSYLIQFANTLKKFTRSDDIVCRIGGDEFIVFLRGTSSHAVGSEKAEAIITAISEDLCMPDGGGHVTASIGIAIAPHDGNDFETLYRKADKSLYYVKNNGKKSYHFYRDEHEFYMSTAKKSTHIDMQYLKLFIQEKEPPEGAYQVEYDGFKKIYQFVARSIGRTDQAVQTILFTITDKEGNAPDSEILSEALDKLKNAVTLSLRRGDVATSYSSSQYIAILPNATLSNGYLVAERVEKSFRQYCDEKQLMMTYDIEMVSQESGEDGDGAGTK